MSRTVCYIDKNTGMSGTCSLEAMGIRTIDCDKCLIKKQFEGKERDKFSYCFWLGDIQELEEFGKEIENRAMIRR